MYSLLGAATKFCQVMAVDSAIGAATNEGQQRTSSLARGMLCSGAAVVASSAQYICARDRLERIGATAALRQSGGQFMVACLQTWCNGSHLWEPFTESSDMDLSQRQVSEPD